MRHGDTIGAKNFNILIRDPDTVSSRGRRGKNTEFGEKCGRCLPVASDASGMLLLGLREVNLHAKTSRRGIFANSSTIVGTIGILGVKRKINTNSSLPRAVKFVGQCGSLAEPAVLVQPDTVSKGNQRTGNIGFDAGLKHSTNGSRTRRKYMSEKEVTPFRSISAMASIEPQ